MSNYIAGPGPQFMPWSWTGYVNESVQAKAEIEQQAMRFALLCASLPVRAQVWAEEADHREALFARSQRETPLSISGWKTPRAAALFSVSEDIISGRLV